MINKFGIFVIESKGFSGWIFGNEKSKYWMQIIFQSKKRFYNPVIQNRNHILALANLLNVHDMNVFKSYIVFSERCELKRIHITKNNLKVIKRDKLILTLQEEYKNSQEYFTNEEINEISEKLLQYMNVNDSIKIKHMSGVEKYKTINR
jgi:restriction endonuclease Mrr